MKILGIKLIMYLESSLIASQKMEPLQKKDLSTFYLVKAWLSYETCENTSLLHSQEELWVFLVGRNFKSVEGFSCQILKIFNSSLKIKACLNGWLQ